MSHDVILTLEIATLGDFLHAFVQPSLILLLAFKICSNTMDYQDQINFFFFLRFDFINT